MSRYNIVVLITGSDLVDRKEDFHFFEKLEECFYGHYCIGTFLTDSSHEDCTSQRVVHINFHNRLVDDYLVKHLKLADLFICVGLDDTELVYSEMLIDLLPTDSEKILISVNNQKNNIKFDEFINEKTFLDSMNYLLNKFN